MKRREFLAQSFAGCAAAIAVPMHSLGMPVEPTTIVARGSDLAWLTERASGLLEITRRFNIKRSRILLKPSMAWNQQSGTGYNSDPVLVDFLVRLLVKEGAREVALFDQCYQNWTSCYRASGIERVAKDATGRVYPGNDLKYYPSPLGSDFRVHQSLVRADLVINLAVAAQIGEKAVGGATAGYLRTVWSLEGCSPTGNSCLQQLLHFRKPDLTINEVWTDEAKDSSSPAMRKKGVVVSLDLLHADQEAARWLGLEKSSFAWAAQIDSERLWKIPPDLTKTIYL